MLYLFHGTTKRTGTAGNMLIEALFPHLAPAGYHVTSPASLDARGLHPSPEPVKAWADAAGPDAAYT
jgi:hypothetical protein